MIRVKPLLLALLLIGLVAPASSHAGARDEEAALDFFEKKIRPLLSANCYNCHSASTNSRGGLRVDDRNGLLQGGGRGPAVVPGQPDRSLLIQAIRHAHPDVKMPPEKRLTDRQVADLVQWVKEGAAWPRARVPATVGRPSAKYARLRKGHWAWQPLRAPPVPAVKDASWPRNAIDRFILAGLEAKGLRPVQDADPMTLARRVTFDLTGLPP